jgi:hypothetical protein
MLQFWIFNKLLPTKSSNLQQVATDNSWFADCNKYTCQWQKSVLACAISTCPPLGRQFVCHCGKKVVCSAFRRHSSPCQMKHVAATWQHSASFESTSHIVSEFVLWKLLISHGGPHAWLPHSPDLTYLLAGIHEGLGVSGEISDTWLTLTLHHGWCCSRSMADISWDTCTFKVFPFLFSDISYYSYHLYHRMFFQGS